MGQKKQNLLAKYSLVNLSPPKIMSKISPV